MSQHVHPVGDNYAISDQGVWLPGSYATFEAGRLALTVKDDKILQELQDSVNPGGTITLEMLRRIIREDNRGL